MASVTRSHPKRGVTALCPTSVLVRGGAKSSYFMGRVSLRFLPGDLLLHRRENGPGGIRTRICDLDRVLCCRYTTGPERIFSGGFGVRKDPGPNFSGARPELGRTRCRKAHERPTLRNARRGG